MGEGAKLDQVFEAFIDGTVDFEQFRAVLRKQLASSPELSASALQRLDALRRANRMTAAVHALMASEVERGSGGDITPPFPEAPMARVSIVHPTHVHAGPAAPAPDPGGATQPEASTQPEGSMQSEVSMQPEGPTQPEGPIQPEGPTPPEIGTVLAGRYRLEALLGRGGMNLVYRAEDSRHASDGAGPAKVAIKLLAPEYTGRVARRVLEWEASVLSGMSHPGIVRALEFNHDQEHPFLVMELLTGERLRGRLVRTHPAPLPMGQAMQLTRELADILAYIHRQGFVHRDLKPANIYITTAGHVSLFDFGLAAPIGGADEVLGPPVRPGTPLYASPEMLRDGGPDPRDDVYSLGCVVYEMLTGGHPWGGLPADEAAHRKLKLARPKGLQKRRWAVLRGALSFRAEDRPADAAAFRSAFFPVRRKNGFLPWAVAAVLAGAAIGVLFMVSDPQQRFGAPAITPASQEALSLEKPASQEALPIGESSGPETAPAAGAVGEPEENEVPGEAASESTANGPAQRTAQPEASPSPIIEPQAEALAGSADSAEPAALPAPPALAFAASRFTIAKSGVALRLELPRPANYQGPLRVRWRTVDGSALNDVDFAGSDQWQLAETGTDAPSVVLFIPIVHNRIPTPSRSFLVELEEVPGGPPVGFPARAEVTIVDR